MLAPVRYVDLGRVGEKPPDRRSGAEALLASAGTGGGGDLDSQGDSGPRISEPPFVGPLSVPRSTSLVGNNLTG